MKSHIVIDGNAFYEVDEECLQKEKERARQAECQRQTGRTPKTAQSASFDRRTPGS